MFNFGRTIRKVRRKLQEISTERTIVLFVDELDRCVPQYTIKILERLHHIFYGLDNVVVVMAIDRKQLDYSVKNMFGKDDSSIDIERYLKKFIDFSMELDYGVINEFYWEKYNLYFSKFVISDEDDVKSINYILPILLSGIDIRRQEKIIEKAYLIHCIVCNESVDISVLVFEVMYAVLKLLGVKDLECVFPVNNRVSMDRNRIGIEKVNLLERMEEKSCHIWNDKRTLYIMPNLFGKIYWYFINIFHDKKDFYVDIHKLTDKNKRELEVAKKYCEFGGMVK